jgi:hypothetical protein
LSANLQLSSRIEQMANDRSARDAWVTRVLGVSVTAGADGAANAPLDKAMRGGPGDRARQAASAKPLQTWADAKEAAGVQIGRLQAAVRGLDHPLFSLLADKGLNGITGRLQAGLQVALTEVESTEGAARNKAREKAHAAVADFRDFLRTDPVLPLVEDNPLGVTITLRADLGQALEVIEQALAA